MHQALGNWISDVLKDWNAKGYYKQTKNFLPTLKKENVFQFNGTETKDAGDGTTPITTKLVLEADEKTGDPILQVNSRLICKLKPHQVEGMYNSIIKFL